MNHDASAQSLRIGVDVGGTFTDLVASDGERLLVAKVPSTPPEYQRGVAEAVARALVLAGVGVTAADVVHGSTVATNALLQRRGLPVAFITTQGFADTLLIGRQNRPDLYALHVRRPAPITPPEYWFAVRERIGADGGVVVPLIEVEIAGVVEKIRRAGLRHAAVCLLFSFINPEHERALGAALTAAGITVSLSCDVLPEFREYERASTTAINAALRPTVEAYLSSLAEALAVGRVRASGQSVRSLSILQSGGGTATPAAAVRDAARLVLSGPAGGVIGAAYVAGACGRNDIITYDMGGTSTDVATLIGGKPNWTTRSTIDGLPLALPMFEIHTVGAGGGSVAAVDSGGALTVGPRSAGARPGPACYDRGGTEPTVTDANVVLGRIPAEAMLGGAMRLRGDLAYEAIASLARRIGKSPIEAALGILHIAEANMAHAVRAVTSLRGHDPRLFTLVSFGGAGGLHAAAIADQLEIPAVLVPPYCGVLSALGMVVAPPVADVSRTVLHLAAVLDDDRLAAEFGSLSSATLETIPHEATASVEAHADCRFAGQSHELKVRVHGPSREAIFASFKEAYSREYQFLPQGRAIEIVTLRVRRIGHALSPQLPEVPADATPPRSHTVIEPGGGPVAAPVLSRGQLRHAGGIAGPAVILEEQATTYVPRGWSASVAANGAVSMEKTQ